MGVSEFIKNRFLGEELAIFVGEAAETITYDQSWASNKEYFQGIVEEVEDGVVALSIPEVGNIYINADNILTFWEPPFDYVKAIKTSLTKKMVGINR